MSVAVKTVAPSHTHRSSSRAPSTSSSSRSGANRTTNDLLERIHAAETRSHRPRSHAGSLILAENRDPRSIEDINAEIAALEAEARAKNLERKAFEERDLAYHIRERPRASEEYDVIEEKRVYRPRKYEDDIVLFDKERSRSRSTRRSGEIYVTPEYRGEEDVVVYERRRNSPPRNVIRVEKDRKGRMALVRSAH